MRVYCIKDGFREGSPPVKRGQTYTAIDVRNNDQMVEWAKQWNPLTDPMDFMQGVYYELEECGKDSWYHETLFCELTVLFAGISGEKRLPEYVSETLAGIR